MHYLLLVCEQILANICSVFEVWFLIADVTFKVTQGDWQH